MRKLMTSLVGVAALCGMTAFAQETSGTNTRQGRGGDEMGVIRNAMKAAEHDPTIVTLLTQALTDRTTLLNSELTATAKLQAAVTAIQGGDKTAIKTAMESAKTAMETVQTNRKTFLQDCKAIHEQLQSSGEENEGRHKSGSGSTAGTAVNE